MLFQLSIKFCKVFFVKYYIEASTAKIEKLYVVLPLNA